MLIAIAKECEVIELTSKSKLGKYSFSGASVSLVLKCLLQKEIVKQDVNKEISPYFFQDVFLAKYIGKFY